MFVNLTCHEIVIIDGPTIRPSGIVARCRQENRVAGDHDGVVLVRSVRGEVEGLPEPQPGVIYIVSALVRLALPWRTDLASPGEKVRYADGRIASKYLAVN